MSASGPPSTLWPNAIRCRPRGSPGARGSIRPPSTNRSGCPPTAGRAGRRPKSLAKIIDATGASLDEFLALVEGRPGRRRHRRHRPRAVPLLGFAQAGAGGFFDDAGFPAGQGWDLVDLPAQATDEASYALQVQGDSMLPLYRDGDVLIVEPSAPIAPGRPRRRQDHARRGDGQGAGAPDGRSRSSSSRSIPTHPDAPDPDREIEWMARIVWASQ